MKMSFFQAKLVSLRKISVMIMTSIPKGPTIKLFFFQDRKPPIELKVSRLVSNGELYRIDLELPFDYPFGSETSLFSFNLGSTPIDLSDVIDFPEFGDMFNYEKDDLGITYTKENTTFKVWAPLACHAFLKYETKENEFSILKMERGEKGVYEATVKGDLLNKRYVYIINNSGVIRESTDPFGYGASMNSEYSAVVDVESLRHKKRIAPKRKIRNALDAVIYELHVRDFTEAKSTDIVNKGKYLGLTETGRKTRKGNPAGLDYLKYLGISHVQLQPILDFNSPDNPDYKKSYNWGYDPISMFAIEGSYSNHPEIPQCRLEEFREVVDVLHQNDIRVNVDVVYNHMFDYLKTSFEYTVPSYFFRRRQNGQLAMASGCGNDFASEKYMARKAILLSVKHLFDTFDIDGLRFDLMGLIDIDTINEVVKIAKSYKEDALIYGEGWNMGYELPFEKKACSENADKMPEVAFFNDSYRDVLKGPTFSSDIRKKGFVNGEFDYAWGFEYVYMGSTINHVYAPRYKKAEQSLNYVECHDNNTLFDKLKYSNEDEEDSSIYDRVKLANALVILSIGMPFIHMGQEIGLSKNLLDNTYNIPRVNHMSYTQLDERIEMAEALKALVDLRNNELAFLKDLNDPKDIEKCVTFSQIDNSLLKITFNPLDGSYKEVVIYVNVTNNTITQQLDKYYSLIFTYGNAKVNGNFQVKNLMIPPRCICVLTLK